MGLETEMKKNLWKKKPLTCTRRVGRCTILGWSGIKPHENIGYAKVNLDQPEARMRL